MNDLRAVREFRAEVPEAGPDRLAAIHDRWTASADATTTGRSRTPAATPRIGSWLGRVPRLGWGVAATGALAAVLGVAVVFAPGDADPGPQGTVTTPAITTVSSTQFLLKMANTVATRPADHSRPDQWIYVKQLIPHTDGAGKVEYRPAETWWRVDGKQTARLGDSGAVEIAPAGLAGDDRSPAQWQRYLASLPTDPQALLDRVRQDVGRSDEKAFSYLLALLREATFASPATNAALFRALVLIPDIQLADDVVDVAGRHGVGISRVRADGTRQEQILNGTSGAYLGQRTVVEDAARVNATRPAPAPPVHNGEVLHAEACLATTVVNKPGQR